MEVRQVKQTARNPGERATLAEARHAFVAGEFEVCLALCDAVRSRDSTTNLELGLLRARVHVRLDRGDRALEALRPFDFSSVSVDHYVLAQMLSGAAFVRLGQKERGECILAEVTEKVTGAHPTVQAEVALHLGIAKFRQGEFVTSERLFNSVAPDQDIVYAHALEYRGWVSQARGDFGAAAERFSEALACLDRCRQRDRYVEAKSLYGLTMLCPELLQTKGWSALEQRLRRFDWSASGLSRWKFWSSIAASMMSETTGDNAGARGWARDATAAAEHDGYRVVALCRLAAVFRGLRETEGHEEFVQQARGMYTALDLRDVGADLQQLPLTLAEEVAHTSAFEDAEIYLSQYRDVVLPMLKSSSGDVDRYVAMERSVEGVLFAARGDVKSMVRTFTAAYDVLSSLGYRRRATALALRLARLTGRKRYADDAQKALEDVSPRFWMARDLAEMRAGGTSGITETEMEILRAVAQGKTYKEIAALRGISWKTVGNHVQTLFRKFGVNSRAELAAEALRRRIVTVVEGRSQR